MKKSEKLFGLLGMSHGAAASRLRKMLLFDMAGKLDRLKCFRCGLAIERIEEFSIEHKRSWAGSGDPVGLFFDLDNIAFSHHSCNCSAQDKPRIYESDQARKLAEYKRFYSDPAKRDRFLSGKRDRYRRDNPTVVTEGRCTRYPNGVPHGTHMKYRNEGCRCQECRDFISAVNRDQHLKRKAANVL